MTQSNRRSFMAGPLSPEDFDALLATREPDELGAIRESLLYALEATAEVIRASEVNHDSE